ncbi:hypothetical protein, partial [Microcoleus sp. S13C4]|uniref:hypothetical protein n=1 Tax=Microcoleus sp. S13C4 TaxID=3055410 RepID=UPI002FD0DD4D
SIYNWMGLHFVSPSYCCMIFENWYYTYSEANLQAIVRQSDLSVRDTGFQATYPANSMTLVAIPKA